MEAPIEVWQSPYELRREFFDVKGSSIILRANNKQLQLSFLVPYVHTRIDNIDGFSNTPGTTTHLYKTAQTLISQVAGLYDRPLIYIFRSQDPNMRRWALDERKGKGIFRWMQIDFEEDCLTARAFIDP